MATLIGGSRAIVSWADRAWTADAGRPKGQFRGFALRQKPARAAGSLAECQAFVERGGLQALL
jgi:hypothetical protein